MGKSVQAQPAAFDSMAEGYDAEFTASALGRVLRPMVWERFAACFAPGSSLLELGCGTGEDAIHLAKLGHRVLATDASAQMVDCARRKAEAAGVAGRIRFQVVPMESLTAVLGTEVFDGVYSNFGAVNCASDLAALAGVLAPRLAPNAPLVWVIMGRFVPWEMGWYLLRGDPRRAFRRFRRAGSEWRGLTIHYPTPTNCARLLEPYFVFDVARPLGVILPPSYAAGWLEMAPRMRAWLSRLERALFERARGAGLGDHYVLEARRAAMSTRPQSLTATPGSPSALASELLEAGRSRPIGSLIGRLLHRWARLRGHHRYDDWRFERWRDLHLVVVPTVSNPRLLRTGVFFADFIDSLPIGPDTRVLDLGTGSGICALVAARRAAQVTAVDINPAAVRCLEANALVNELQNNVDARHGDLFSPVNSERFDFVFFNPPFLLGEPCDARDAAWRGAGVAEAFAAELRKHLRPGGVALLLLSSWGDACPLFVDELARRGFTQTVGARRYHINETVTILKVTAQNS